MKIQTFRSGLSVLLAIVVCVAMQMTTASTAAQSAGEWQFEKVDRWEWVRNPQLPKDMTVSGSGNPSGGSLVATIGGKAYCPSGNPQVVNVSWTFPKPVDKLLPDQAVKVSVKLDYKDDPACGAWAAYRSRLAVRYSTNGGVLFPMPASAGQFWEESTGPLSPMPAGAKNEYGPTFPDDKAGDAYVRVSASTPKDGTRGFFALVWSTTATPQAGETVAFAYTYKWVQNPGPTPPPSPPPPPPQPPTGGDCGKNLTSAIHAKWLEKGGESYYGCPESDPRPGSTASGGTSSTVVDFPKHERAQIVEHTSGPLTGRTFVVDECFGKLYRQMGGTSSWIGLPTSDGTPTTFGARQEFQNGYMIWNSSNFQCEARKKGDVVDPGSSTPTRMTLEARDYTVEPGGTVQVPIYLKNGENVANMNFTVAYDTGVARIEGSAAKGNLLSGSLFSSNPAEARLFRGAFAGTTGVSGDGTVAYIPFRAVGPAGSKTPLTLAVTTINQPGGNTPAIRLINGSITIKSAMAGDCDGDGKISAGDALCALEMSVKLMPVRMLLDADGSGDVTSRDATVILQRIVR